MFVKATWCCEKVRSLALFCGWSYTIGALWGIEQISFSSKISHLEVGLSNEKTEKLL